MINTVNSTLLMVVLFNNIYACYSEATMTFIDWFSIASIVLNVLLIMLSVGLAVNSWKANNRNKSQVKIWMEQANGLNQALLRIIWNKWENLYSTVTDVTNSVHIAQAASFSLYQSLYDERVVSEEDYKARQEKIWKKLDEEILNQDKQTDVKSNTMKRAARASSK